MQATDASRYLAPPSLARFQQKALWVGVTAVVLSAVGLFTNREQFFRSYLVGFVYVAAFPLGCLALMMLHHITKGAWGVVLRRMLEAATRTIPLLALLFIPVALGAKSLYIWTDPEVLAHDELVAGKTGYLNLPFFLARAGFYFVVWWALATILGRFSHQQDESGDPALAIRMQAWSGAGLGLYVITASFASFDWLMSLDPHWFSSIYGIYFVGSQILTALAFVIPVAMFLARTEPMASVYRPSHFHDFAKLMLAFTMLWAYFSLSQFLIIWSGNLPEEVPWYIDRTEGPWKLVSQGLILFHFVLPFLLLLSTNIKRDARRLGLVALLILVMRWVDVYWQAAPALHVESFHWLDLAIPVGLGGIWLAYFAWQLRRRPLLPVQEPFLQEALDHE